MELFIKLLTWIFAFVIGFAALYLLMFGINTFRRRLQKKKRDAEKSGADKKKERTKPKIGKMDFILIMLGIFLLWFTNRMIGLFETYGAVPDTLITCVFAVCGGECGVMGWIKNTNEKYRDRKWQVEDRTHEEKKAGIAPDMFDP